METLKPIEQMTRTEVIYALKSHAHQDVYISLLRWPTFALKALLLYYLSPEEDHVPPKIYWEHKHVIVLCKCHANH